MFGRGFRCAMIFLHQLNFSSKSLIQIAFIIGTPCRAYASNDLRLSRTPSERSVSAPTAC
jgi:hypothetical protein